MATEINPIVRPWSPHSHHTHYNLHAQYTAQSAQWRDGRGPQFHEVTAVETAPVFVPKQPWWKIW